MHIRSDNGPEFFSSVSGIGLRGYSSTFSNSMGWTISRGGIYCGDRAGGEITYAPRRWTLEAV